MIKIVSYNIRGGLGMDGIRDIHRIGTYLKTLDADLICLQEVHKCLPQSGNIDQPLCLAEQLRMTCTFSSTLSIGEGKYGIATFSRLPVLSATHLRLPNIRERLKGIVWRERRTAVAVEVLVDGRSISVWNTHWSLNAKDRLCSAERLATALPSNKVVLVGDFNAGEGSGEIARLMELTGLQDAGVAEKICTFPSDEPRHRIDRFFHSPELNVIGMHVPDSPLSDHLPVIAGVNCFM